MAQQASLEFYDAHSDVIVEWEFDATMDYKVCERCAPLNGNAAKTVLISLIAMTQAVVSLLRVCTRTAGVLSGRSLKA